MNFNDLLAVNFTKDGWINATPLAEFFGRRLQYYFDSVETQRYIYGICNKFNFPSVDAIVRRQRGKKWRYLVTP